MKSKKKIAYVTGARADFGLILPVLRAIKRSAKLSLQIYATGMHLTPEFGDTFKEVKKEFPEVTAIRSIFRGTERTAMAEFAGDFLKEVVGAFSKNRPDFVLILGDRVEMLCVAVACLYLGIPSSQFYGGEKTFSADEVARHAITKLVSLHLTNTKKTAGRILRMGEEKWRIHVVGAPGVDGIMQEKLPTRRAVCRKLGINPENGFILLAEHPVTEEWRESGAHMREILTALKTFGLPIVAMYPNADTGGREIVEELLKEKNNPLFRIFPSLPYREFLALEREAAVLVGNSSALVLESASFKTPAVLIGTRQSGRERGSNVITAGYDRKEIERSVRKALFDRAYRARLRKVKNPWGDGKASARIVKILEGLNLDKRLLVKQITYP